MQPPNYCLKCGALETDPARDDCVNAIWHLPHWTGQVPLPPKKPRVEMGIPDEKVDG